MKKYLSFGMLIAVFVCAASPAAAEVDAPVRKVVVWKAGTDADIRAGRLADRGRHIKDIPLVNASVVEMNEADAAELMASPDVISVSNDPIATIAVREFGSRAHEERTQEDARAAAHRGVTAKVQAQTIPWGIAAIRAPQVWPSGNSADPIEIAIIDTGISSSHPDLKANLKGGVNTIWPFFGSNDDNGHGSHVAGIVGALNNAKGVVGGAPLVNLYAVKVLNSSGSGYYSDIIEGIQWAIANHMQVINMSLGGSADYGPMHDAVVSARNAGIVVVAAAGNSGGSVIYPAAYPEVIAVSATDNTNTITSWSSRGSEVDLAAPGSSIYSTYKGSQYATLSGTSMAAPHVAASAALVLNTPVGAADSNGNGAWDPSEVQTRLSHTAQDLGVPGPDSLYGYGLVDAFAATQ